MRRLESVCSNRPFRDLVTVGLALAASLGLASVAQGQLRQPRRAEPADEPRRASAAPNAAEVKVIAEEGFVYGLPIVMNYAVQYEFCVDKKSDQYKGPFNTISGTARVFTYKDTTVITPNSDTPYSMLWLDLRAEPMVLSVPAIEKSR